MRTLTSELARSVGGEVELKGWAQTRRDHGKIVFIDLRDRSGIVQLVVTPKEAEAYATAQAIRAEWVIAVRGTVAERPASMVNPDQPLGNLEIQVRELTVLAEAKTPPFDLTTDGREVSEEARMRYRYLDLRRERVRENLRARHRVTKYMRDFLTERDFVEIETPILGKSTPEGARDYIVPSRLYPGSFYALPQSPQQYKQLLMVGGLERYFQVARCFRDEDTRGDRQPEFTQLDIEMSFTDEEEVMGLIEELYLSLVRTLYPAKKLRLTPEGRVPRMSYAEAMERYQSDKPDLRDNPEDPDELAFLFVTDFPMFEWSETEKRWDATHHPFTQPKVASVEEFRERFAREPGAIRAKQYDFVLNGYEIGGGSIRTHDPELLAAVFEVMGHAPENVRARFGHLLEAFEYGVPPHGGVAPGIDRFVMILQSEPNIREVIAFPKTGDGRDLLMGAPDVVEEKKLAEANISVRVRPEKREE